MESPRGLQQPSISLTRTKMLLEFLGASYGSDSPTLQNMVSEQNFQKGVREYLNQVVGFIKTACDYLEYYEMDVPADMAEYVKNNSSYNYNGDKLSHDHIAEAKRIIAVSLTALRQITV